MINSGIKRVLSYALKSKICASPLYLRLGITNDCNLRCIMCPNKYQNDKKGYMNFDIFKKAVDDTINVVKHIGFSYSGEALLHHDVVKFIEYINKLNSNVIVGIVTNATLLDVDMSYKLLKAGLNSITFSVDSFDKKMYENIRKGAKYENVINNIEEFIKIKKQLNKHVHMTVSTINFFDKKEYSIPVSIKQNVIVNKIPLHNYGGNINIKKTKKGKYYFPCRFPWSSVVVSWNGNVLPCCIDHYQKEIIGNVMKKNTLSIWNSEKMQEIRKNLANNKLPQLCINCDMLYHNSPKDILKKIKSIYKV